ncbi:MAG: glucose 1-dehydrogenase [Rhodospirillaceae bacterium]|nr:glucose 1-dehydrogenase [Rhodospirillaceae bacterium]
MTRLTNKTALITGAASGIGRAVAARLADEGAHVALADFNRDAGVAAAEAIGDAALFVDLDVSREDAWQAGMAAVRASFGGLDILVNSAGVISLHSIEDTSLDEWRRVMGVNLDGTFLGCRFGVAAMKDTGGGSIINMSSVSGLVGGANLAAYNASKGGVRLLTKSVALHCAKKGYDIRCNSVHPSFVSTPMVDDIADGARDPDRARDAMAAQIPLGRMGSVEEVAGMVAYLASDEAAFVTGSEFVIDGGLTA